MSLHTAIVRWARSGAVFTDNRYSRVHHWEFDGGVVIPTSASPWVVPVPLSDPAGVDPEEAFVAALSSCHMLWFLSLAANRGFVVDRYEDLAAGSLGRDAQGRLAITRVVLRPMVVYTGEGMEPGRERELHEEAHGRCYLASSVRSEIVIEPRSAESEPPLDQAPGSAPTASANRN